MNHRKHTMIRSWILFLLAAVVCVPARAQLTRHLVTFKDKKGSPHTLQSPSGFLSPKSIARRARYNIALDSTDLPVSRAYLDSLASVRNVRIINHSRWLNQVLIQTTDASAIQQINRFSFVSRTSPIGKRPVILPDSATDKFDEPISEPGRFTSRQQPAGINAIDYGSSYGQVHIHEGEYLHDQGFQGEGMTIAVLDAGFLGFLTNPAFDSVRKNQQILGTWDYLTMDASVNEDHVHGMYCFSILAANRPGLLVGTAPKASYYLFRTEDNTSEFPVEEHCWVVGAEAADSLGVDVITSSLGYNTFDDPAFNHTYADMNGNATMITRAADLAVKKGMIVTNSAGNSGTGAWKYIVAPADGDSVLAIGAVNVNGQVAAFSSYGPSADGRIKPDVASVGWGTFLANTSGNPAQGNGTSFANPNLAGLITCLWQAFPEFRNTEIIDALKKNSGRFSNPDDRTGYGIPNLKQAFEFLLEERKIRRANEILGDAPIKVYPLPFRNQLTVLYRSGQGRKLSLDLIDVSGRVLQRKEVGLTPDQLHFIDLDGLDRLPAGPYFLRYIDGTRKGTIRLVK